MAVPSVAKKNGKTKSGMHVFLMTFGRTDLIISQSRAKFCEESAGDVRFCVAPQKPGKNMQKRVFEAIFFEQMFLTSKIEMFGIVRNAFPKSFVAIGADFEG